MVVYLSYLIALRIPRIDLNRIDHMAVKALTFLAKSKDLPIGDEVNENHLHAVLHYGTHIIYEMASSESLCVDVEGKQATTNAWDGLWHPLSTAL